MWIRRFIVFHGKKHPSVMGGAEIRRYLTYLAVERKVSASTQNQALSALLFLYKQVLRVDPGAVEHVPHAQGPTRVPVVLSVDEVRAVMEQLTGLPRMIAALLYGAGLRLQESLELRVKDLATATRSSSGVAKARRIGGRCSLAASRRASRRISRTCGGSINAT